MPETPPLPAGYTEDKSTPPLPEGYSVESPEVKKNGTPNSKTGTPPISPFVSSSELSSEVNPFEQGKIKREQSKQKYNTFQTYESAQKKLSAVDKALNSSEIKFANTVVDPSEKQYLIERKAQLEQERIKSKQEASANYGQTQKELDETINTELKTNGADHFIKTNESGFKVADPYKIDEYAKNLSLMSGMGDEGYFKDLVYNRMKAQVEYEIAKPKIEQTFDTLYKKKYGTTPQKDVQEDFTKNFKSQQEVEQQLTLQTASAANKIKQDAEAEFGVVKQTYQPQLEGLNNTYKSHVDNINAQAQKLNQLLQVGQISQQEYSQNIQELQAASQQLNTEYTQQFNQTATEYLNAQREINGKYSARYNRQVAELKSMADAKLRLEQEKYSKQYKISPELEKRYKETWAEASNAYASSEEALKAGLDSLKSTAYMFGQSFISGLGGAVRSMSTSLGYDTGRVMGDYLSSLYSLSNPEIKDAKDLLDLTKLTRSAGEMIGGMAPLIVGQTITAVATGGASIPVQLAIQGGLGFTLETAQMGGAIYDETFAKTGNVLESEKAAAKVMQGNLYLLPLYAVDGLPFIEKASLGVKNALVSGVVKGAIETGTELPQEFFQNAFEDLARNNQEINEIGKYMTLDRLENTALNIIPSTFAMGALPTYASSIGKKWSEIEAKSLAAKHDLSRLSDTAMQQYMYDMYLRYGETFSKAYLSGLYQSQKIDEVKSTELLKVLDSAKQVLENSEKFGLEKGQSKVYAALLFGYQNATMEAEKATDELVKQALTKKANELKTVASDFLVNKRGDFSVIVLPNNEQYIVTTSQASDMLNDESFAEKVGDGEIKIVSHGAKDSEQSANLAAQLKTIADGKEVRRNAESGTGGTTQQPETNGTSSETGVPQEDVRNRVSEGEEEKVAPELKDVESTAKALRDNEENGGRPIPSWLVDDNTFEELNKGVLGLNDIISEAYHQAKKDGSNPELVKAVEELLGVTSQPEKTQQSETQEVVIEPAPKTELSNMKLSSKLGDIKTGEINDAKLKKGVVDKTIAKDKDGNPIKVYINFDKLKAVLLSKNGKNIFRAMQGRFFVIARVGDFYLPFYISSAGTSGKNQGEWYPFFGYNNWLIKGYVGKNGEMEYTQKVDEVTKLLNENLQIPAKYFTQFGQIISGGTPLNPTNVFYDINEDLNYESWFVDFDRNKGNTYTEDEFVADRTGLNPKGVKNDGGGSADAWINDVLALTENIELASKGVSSQPQKTQKPETQEVTSKTPAKKKEESQAKTLQTEDKSKAEPLPKPPAQEEGAEAKNKTQENNGKIDKKGDKEANQNVLTSQEEDTGGEKPPVVELAPEEKSNLQKIESETGVNFREIQNVYTKYGEGKPLTEITKSDFKAAQKVREQVKKDAAVFEKVLAAEKNKSTTLRERAVEAAIEETENPRLKEIAANLEDIKKQLMDKVGLSEECSW